MSNLRRGEVIHASDDDFRLIYHPDNGHVVAWNQNYYDGRPLGTWRSSDYGTPEEAAEVLPGLSTQILEVSRKGAR